MTASLLILVPARGGSKRLPGKNLRPLAGRSLIAHTADAIAEAGLDAPVLLSTDDPAIAAEGRRVGMTVPFVRPAGLANDTATSVDVALHALDWFAAETGAEPDLLMLLQPTSPLRGGRCLTVAQDMLAHRPDAGSVVAMSALHLPPAALFLADKAGHATALSTDGRRPVYAPNGALYLTRTAHLRALHSLYAPPVLPLVMDQRRSVDIDTPADWAMAEALLAAGLPEQQDTMEACIARPSRTGTTA
ncbi:MAG: acylneuraminate cytidylyltransferase family protein [Alphaproteobacteria bacterium]